MPVPAKRARTGSTLLKSPKVIENACRYLVRQRFSSIGICADRARRDERPEPAHPSKHLMPGLCGFTRCRARHLSAGNHDLLECADDGGVELRSGAATQFRKRLIDGLR